MRQAAEELGKRLRRRLHLPLVDGDERRKSLSLGSSLVRVEGLELSAEVCDFRLPGVEEEDEVRPGPAAAQSTGVDVNAAVVRSVTASRSGEVGAGVPITLTLALTEGVTVRTSGGSLAWLGGTTPAMTAQ